LISIVAAQRIYLKITQVFESIKAVARQTNKDIEEKNCTNSNIQELNQQLLEIVKKAEKEL